MNETMQTYQRAMRWLVAATIAWGFGGTYWYVCKTEGLCTTANAVSTVDVPESVPLSMSSDGIAGSQIQGSLPQPSTSNNPGSQRLLFLPDGAEPADDYSSYLDMLTTYMAENPGVKVEVTGYATNLQSAVTDDANAVGLERAVFVLDQLKSRGVNPERITVQTKGDSQQVGDTSTEDGAAQNRRAEVTIL